MRHTTPLRNAFVAFVAAALAACTSGPAAIAPTPGAAPDANAAILALRATPNAAAPPAFLSERMAIFQRALQSSTPVILLDAGLDAQQRIAQETALRDGRFTQYARTPQGEPLRNEIFQIYPARDSDLTPETQSCKQSVCYRVEMYSYAYNAAIIAIVDVNTKQALAVGVQAGLQPDLPPHLVQLATQIAVNAPEVQSALGYKPEEREALMAGTKTSLNKSRCERSRHLCVAPTFVKGDRALWAIVDLTDNTLVGVRWTNVGSTGLAVTERKLQNSSLTDDYCTTERDLERDGWSLKYILTSSDGLRISEVRYQGKPQFRSVKMVDWHVSYSNTDGFGYSDAIGCPYFSHAAVIAIEPPRITPIEKDGATIGFAIEQRFQSEGWPTPCNYNYRQRFEFYTDGRFRPMIASIGRGCGNDGIYRPVTRIAYAAERAAFAEWSAGAWKDWSTEQWQLQTPETDYTPEGYRYRMTDGQGTGYFVEPSRGQFGDGGRGDFAWTYVTRHDAGRDEGESDLITVGPCCNSDYRQGPERFIEPAPEALAGGGLVMWYVAQLKNDNTPGREYCWAESVLVNGVFDAREFPCYSGPMFVPVKP
jgi:hypothetical protein